MRKVIDIQNDIYECYKSKINILFQGKCLGLNHPNFLQKFYSIDPTTITFFRFKVASVTFQAIFIPGNGRSLRESEEESQRVS